MNLKNVFLSVVFWLFLGFIHAQNASYPISVGPTFGTIQYHGDMTNEFWKTTDLNGSIGINVNGYLKDQYFWTVNLYHGIIGHSKWFEGDFYSFSSALYGIDLRMNYNLADDFFLEKKFPVKPILTAGIGDVMIFGDHYESGQELSFTFPIGLGLSWPINERWAVNSGFVNHYTLTDKLDNVDERYRPSNFTDRFMNISFSVQYNFSMMEDEDRDGVPDDQDNCPEDAGPLSTAGCPDQDKDGIPDKDDKCPTVAGVVVNNGCPEIPKQHREAMKKIRNKLTFETGSEEISSDMELLLNEVVQVMKNNPVYKLSVSAHTDNTGNAEFNLKLSTKRAEAVKVFLVSQGIKEDRIKAQGFGGKNPVASNDTPEGRKQNRRVEFRLGF